jgi:hypothetical protein
MNIYDVPLVVVAVLVVFALVFFAARNEIVRRRLKCPRTGTDADVSIKRRFEGNHRALRVTSCSLLADPTHVDCGQDCIREHAAV